MATNLLKGIVFSLGACLIWGLLSVIPLYMEGFTPTEITFGRFLIYGTVSCLLFLPIYLRGTSRYPRSMWLKALGFSLGCILCDYFFVLSTRYSCPAISTVVLAVSPISIAFYGNWLQRECSNKSLILPSMLIFIGLAVINVPIIIDTATPTAFLLGLFFAVLSLASWSWYVVSNSAFLKVNPHVNSKDWATLVGVLTLIWVLVLGIIHSIFEEQFDFTKYLVLNNQLTGFLLGSLVLGVVCSWVGAYLWNKASLNLPVSLLGLMMIFSTVFGLCYVYLYDQQLPSKLEFLGIVFLLAAIIYGIRSLSKTVEEKQPAG